jgi:hypothetical protein
LKAKISNNKEKHYSNFHRERKSTYSASFFEAEKMFFPNAGTIEKQAVPDIARHVQMNGCAASVKSQESNAPNVPTKQFIKVSDDVIRQHLTGKDAQNNNATIGVYPLLPDERCWFLAADL